MPAEEKAFCTPEVDTKLPRMTSDQTLRVEVEVKSVEEGEAFDLVTLSAVALQRVNPGVHERNRTNVTAVGTSYCPESGSYMSWKWKTLKLI